MAARAWTGRRSQHRPGQDLGEAAPGALSGAPSGASLGASPDDLLAALDAILADLDEALRQQPPCRHAQARVCWRLHRLCQGPFAPGGEPEAATPPPGAGHLAGWGAGLAGLGELGRLWQATLPWLAVTAGAGLQRTRQGRPWRAGDQQGCLTLRDRLRVWRVLIARWPRVTPCP